MSQEKFNPYMMARLVEDLINTYDLYLDEPEHLRQPDDLSHFLKTHDFDFSEVITTQTLEQVRELRQELRTCWLEKKDMAHLLNPLLAKESVIIQIDPSSLAIQLEFDPMSALLPRLTVACAWGIMTLAQNHGLERLRSCEAEPCRDVFVDTSRNKSRRFCSERCANRYNVAVFRDRQKGKD